MFLIQFQWRRRSPNLDINFQDNLTLSQEIGIGHPGHRCVATARQNIMLYNVIKQIYFKLPRIGKSKVRLSFDNCQVLSLHSHHSGMISVGFLWNLLVIAVLDNLVEVITFVLLFFSNFYLQLAPVATLLKGSKASTDSFANKRRQLKTESCRCRVD